MPFRLFSAMAFFPALITAVLLSQQAVHCEIAHQEMARLSLSEPSEIERVNLRLDGKSNVQLSSLPTFRSIVSGKATGRSNRGDTVVFTVDPALQHFVETLVSTSRAPHAAIVVMEPSTGAILAVSGRSQHLSQLPLHAEFPAASVFKLVTAAGALERRAILPDSAISFRGGNYTLTLANFRPDSRKDRRRMAVGEALGRSCNPVFGRLALRFVGPAGLRWYAGAFGFNQDLLFDVPLAPSSATIPSDDYELSRTGAGFGRVTLSPIHAASLVAGVANGGLLPRPRLVEKVISAGGSLLYQSHPEMLRRMISYDTAMALLEMMENTITIGTSRSAFSGKGRPALGGIRVAAKTGTLRGDSPEGLNNWFVAAAPLKNPKVALAVIVVNSDGTTSKASFLGRRVLERYFNIAPAPSAPKAKKPKAKVYKVSAKGKSKSKVRRG